MNGFFDRRDRRCGARVGIFGRLMRARGEAEGVSFERGSGGGIEGGGKLTRLVWQFLGVTAV